MRGVGVLHLRMRVHCRYAGDEIVPADVHMLINGIYRCVFDTKQLDEPLAVEIPPVGNKRRTRLWALREGGPHGLIGLHECNKQNSLFEGGAPLAAAQWGTVLFTIQIRMGPPLLSW